MRFLKQLWVAWKTFAHGLGRVQTVILLTLFYLFILGPVSLFLRLLGKSPLAYAAQNSQTYWRIKPVNHRGEAQYYQQF